MIRICCALEILQVAAHAGRVRAGQVVVVVDVALHALDAGVRSRQGESRGRVIKRRARPGGRAVALLASLREARSDVIGIRRSLEVFQVATDASRVRAGQVVVAVHVALRTLNAGMRAGQRKAGGVVIESGARPGRGAVTLLTSLREARSDVIGIRCALEVFQVATDASRVRTREIVVAIHVTLRALQCRVRPR